MVNCELVCLIFEQDDSSPCGLLMSYGPDMPDYFRKAAGCADKMLNGARPADASRAAGPSQAGDQSPRSSNEATYVAFRPKAHMTVRDSDPKPT